MDPNGLDASKTISNLPLICIQPNAELQHRISMQTDFVDEKRKKAERVRTDKDRSRKKSGKRAKNEGSAICNAFSCWDEDDSDNEACNDADLNMAIELSLTWPVVTTAPNKPPSLSLSLDAYAEELHTNYALTLSKRQHQPYHPTGVAKVFTLTTVPVDVLVPELVRRGSWRDLVSFCNIGTYYYRRYRMQHDAYRSEMFSMRILAPIPHFVTRHYYRRPMEHVASWYSYGFFGVAHCDAARSLTKDTLIYIRQDICNYFGKDISNYYYMRCDATSFSRGYNYNEAAKLLLQSQ